ncbi:MAG: 6-phosphofructokinase [Deltaproteobacteria bacterium]|nr:6-phosphofructokinase [Deltaproteobacteria bacterium]
MTIGIVTGGGDAPGLNAVIRAVHRAATRRGMRVVGFRDGFDGLLHPETAVVLDRANTAGILGRGGTILGTSNRGSFTVKTALGTPHTLDPSLIERVRATMHQLAVSTLVCVGGDGSLTIALQLAQAGIPVVGIPKTIDNDLSATDFTFGFDSAVAMVTEALDRLHPTAYSHRRIMVLEVMGRHAGWIALYGGIAGGADVILIPEIPFDLDVVARTVRAREDAGRHFTMVVVAEGAAPAGGEVRATLERDREAKLGGIGPMVTTELERRTGKEARCVVLGHLQRGGAPTNTDRVLATAFGTTAVGLVEKSCFGAMVALQGSHIVAVPIADAVGAPRRVSSDYYLLQVARDLGVSFGES